MTGYIVKKKKLHYYKCNKIGCRCNRSAKQMNQLFEKLLRDYQIDECFKEPLKDQLLLTYQRLTSTDKEIGRTLKQNLRDIELKLEKIEERFALGEIDRPVYDK